MHPPYTVDEMDRLGAAECTLLCHDIERLIESPDPHCKAYKPRCTALFKARQALEKLNHPDFHRTSALIGMLDEDGYRFAICAPKVRVSMDLKLNWREDSPEWWQMWAYETSRPDIYGGL